MRKTQDASFSEEKEAKRLLLPCSFMRRGEALARSRGGTKVFWFFFSKKNKTSLIAL
jgi:hypothetical protein